MNDCISKSDESSYLDEAFDCFSDGNVADVSDHVLRRRLVAKALERADSLSRFDNRAWPWTDS